MTTLHRETNPIVGIFVSLVSLLSASTALAATTWDFRTGASGISQTVVGSAWGNTRTFTIGSDSVAVTAWADDGTVPAMSYRTAHSGQYDTGLGICNRSEAIVAGSLALCDQDGGVRDQVDNVGNNDFMLFVFSSAQTMQSITIDPYGAFDRDVSYWVGNVSGTINLTGLTVANLAGLGFGPQTDSFNGIGDPPLTINLGNVTGNAILFSAVFPPNANADKFKIQSMVTTPTTNVVPVPAALWLFASALGALSAARSRILKTR